MLSVYCHLILSIHIDTYRIRSTTFWREGPRWRAQRACRRRRGRHRRARSPPWRWRARGCEVTVLERAATPGGKMREVDDRRRAHRRRADRLHHALGVRGDLRRRRRIARRPRHAAPAEILARHAWATASGSTCSPTSNARPMPSAPSPARPRRGAIRQFCAEARRIFEHARPALHPRAAAQPARADRQRRPGGLGDLWQIKPFSTLWRALGDYFHDPRLRQLFGRYATYCGSSPFLAPATLMLVAHVEQEGVWLVEGGMHRLAAALADLAPSARRHASATARRCARSPLRGGRAAGVRLADGERIAADAVVVNADVARRGRRAASAAPSPAPRRPTPRSGALALGHDLGAAAPRPRASRWCATTCSSRATMPAEFDDIFQRTDACRRRPPSMSAPRTATTGDQRRARAPERLLCLVNAPARRATPTPSTPRRSSDARHGRSACWSAAACGCGGGRSRRW